MNSTVNNYDVVVIGSGPGGYVSAIRAAQLGKKVAIIEKSHMGGTCLNVGCIPSKLMLAYGKKVSDIKKANDWGIKTSSINIDYDKLLERKTHVVQTLTGGVTQLLKKNKVDIFEGKAQITEDLSIHCNQHTIQSKDIILATGSHPFIPPIKGLNEINYETTDTFFNLSELPQKLTIIGGGVIATELASSMADLGVKVTMIEVAEDILLTEIEEVRTMLKKQLKSQNISIHTNINIDSVSQQQIILEDDTNITHDKLLVATGRKPNTKSFESLNLKQNKDFVSIDSYYRTSINHVYAIGDLIDGYQLAHAASSEGIIASETIAGLNPSPIQQTQVPRCIYTKLEATSIGMDEDEAKANGYDIEVTQSTLQGNAKAIIQGENEGFIKLVVDKKYKEVLGAFIVSPEATNLIGELLSVKSSEGTINELSNIIQPHPSLSESIGESADNFFNKAIHM